MYDVFCEVASTVCIIAWHAAAAADYDDYDDDDDDVDAGTTC